MTRAELAAIARQKIEALTEGNGELNRTLDALTAIVDAIEAPADPLVKIEACDVLEWDGLPRPTPLRHYPT
jgi:hypothetical protein